MTTDLTIELQEQLQILDNLVFEGLDKLREAGEFVVELLKDFTVKEISQNSSYLTQLDIKQLAAIGEKKMSPSLFVFRGPANKSIGRLPLETQNQVLENGVDVLVVNPQGKIERQTFAANRLKRAHCKIAFSGNKVNSISTQKKLILNPPEKLTKPGAYVADGRLWVNKNSSFSKQELQAFLKLM